MQLMGQEERWKNVASDWEVTRHCENAQEHAENNFLRILLLHINKYFQEPKPPPVNRTPSQGQLLRRQCERHSLSRARMSGLCSQGKISSDSRGCIKWAAQVTFAGRQQSSNSKRGHCFQSENFTANRAPTKGPSLTQNLTRKKALAGPLSKSSFRPPFFSGNLS